MFSQVPLNHKNQSKTRTPLSRLVFVSKAFPSETFYSWHTNGRVGFEVKIGYNR